MISPSKYIEAKLNGLLTVIKLEEEFGLDVKKFSPEDGTELSPTRHNINITQLQAAKVTLQAELINLDIMIADLEALK